MIDMSNNKPDYSFNISFGGRKYVGEMFFDRKDIIYSLDDINDYNPKSGKIYLFDEYHTQVMSYTILDGKIRTIGIRNKNHQNFFEEMQVTVNKYLKYRCFS